MKKKIIASLTVLGFAPLLAFAQTGATACSSGYVANLSTIQGVICKIGDILDTLIPILIVLGVVFFVWGVVSYIVKTDEEGKAKGRERMIWGIIGLVVIVGLWGLVHIVTNTFQLNGTGTINYPNVPY